VGVRLGRRWAQKKPSRQGQKYLVEFVNSLKVPEDVIADYINRGHQLFRRLTGQVLCEFQEKHMKIAA